MREINKSQLKIIFDDYIVRFQVKVAKLVLKSKFVNCVQDLSEQILMQIKRKFGTLSISPDKEV